MERLKIGDIVKAKYPDWDKIYIGIISAILMFDDDSIDNCDYAIICDITEEQIERAKNSSTLGNGAAWFRRQDIVVLEESRLGLYKDKLE